MDIKHRPRPIERAGAIGVVHRDSELADDPVGPDRLAQPHLADDMPEGRAFRRVDEALEVSPRFRSEAVA